MSLEGTEFDLFEQQFLQFIGEYQYLNTSESLLRSAVRAESTRAEAAEAERDAAVRSAAEARSGAAGSSAAAAHVAALLAAAQEELAGAQVQLQLLECERAMLEERNSDLSGQVRSLEQEVQKLSPVQANHAALQQQYKELQERVRIAVEEAKNEAERLEREVRRVEKACAGGGEVRERARLAAAAHQRERTLLAAELQHTSGELRAANLEIARLAAQVSELQHRLSHGKGSTSAGSWCDEAAMSDARAALSAERDAADRLERALAAALADNAALAASLHDYDNANQAQERPPSPKPVIKKIIYEENEGTNPLESFLAE